MRKRLLSILIALCLCLTLLPTAAFAATTMTPDVWDGSTAAKLTGSGTSEDDPYLISTGAELKLLAENSRIMDFGSRYVKLTNDIILNDGTFEKDGSFTKTGESNPSVPNEWLPAGKATWHIDGGGHYISGLYIKLNEDRIGLFSYTYNGGYIKNLTIKNSYVFSTKSGAYVGVFAGTSFRTSFINCVGENNIVGTNGCYSTAGVVGWAEEGSFSGVHTSGSVSGNNILGGIAGRTMDTTFKNCWNETNIDNEKATIRQSGGIAGMASSANFYNCANLGYLHGGSRVGGIVGEANNVKVKNCYGLSDIADTGRDWWTDNGKWRYFYYTGTLVGTEGSMVSFSYAQDGYERNDYGENGVVPHFTGKGDLGGGDEGELLDALNANLYKMEGEPGLNEWVRTGDGYPLPIGGSFVDNSKYYDIWLDGVRVGERNAADILENGLAAYDDSTKTLYLHDGLTITNGDAAENSLLLANGDLNLCIDGTVRFISNMNIGSGASVIDLGIDVGGGGALRIYTPEGKSATVSVIANNPSYGLDLSSLTLDGNVSMSVRTNLSPCFAFCNTFTLTSPQAMLDAVNLGGGFAMLNVFSSINLPSTNAQKFYEGSADTLTRVDRFTTQKEVEGQDAPKYFMYPHIRIAPEVSEAYDSLPASLTVSMETANDEASLKTWAKTQLADADCFESVNISGAVSATAGTFANPSGTSGSFTAAVTVLKNDIRLTKTIPGVITATAYTAPTISTTFRVGTVNAASGIFEEKIDKTFTCGEKIVFAVTYTSNSTAVQDLTGTVTCFHETKALTWSEANSCYLSPVEASSCFTCPTVADYTASYTIEGTGEYEQKTDNLSLTVEGLTLKASDFTFSPPSDLVYDGNAKTASLQFNGSPELSVTPVVKYCLNGSPVSEVKETGVYTVKLDVAASSYYKPVTDLSDSSWTFTIVKPSATIDLLPNANDLTYNGLPQELVTPGSSANGALLYSTSENGSYTSSIPTGTAAGDYTVYWYVQGDDTHSDSDKQHIEVKIKAKSLDSSDVSTDQIAVQAYSGSDLMPETRVKDGDAVLSAGHDYTLAYENNKFVGTAGVKITGIGNYAGEIATNFTIIPKQLTALDFSGITVTKIYDGTTGAGTLTGTVGFNGKVSTDDISIKAVPGVYADANVGQNKHVTLALSLEGTGKANYTLSEEDKTHEFTAASITEADGSVTAPKQVDGLRYNGKMQTLVTGGSSTTGEIRYKLGESGTYGTALPQAKDAGSHKVYYKVVGDSNHKDVEEDFITVEIKAAELTVTAKDKNAYIGSKAPDLGKPELSKDYVVDGLIGEDRLLKAPVLSYDPAAPDMTKIGEAAKIIANGADAGSNYSITYAAGKLILSQRSSSSGSVTYPVNVPGKTENGSVTVSPKNASAGSTVTITVKPDSGYVLETITATDQNGSDLKLADKGGGKYTFTMPASKVEVKATFMEDNSVLNFFYDVPNDAYYYEAVKWAAENGITGGVGNSLFAPNQPCTRAQIVTFLWRAAGSPVVNYRMPFTDVDEGAYYAEAVRWAASCGIVTGLTETTFGTNGVCTRAQAAAMIYRYAQAQGKGFTGAWMFRLPFTDVPEWAYESVAWCYMNGVTTGVSETAFAPGNDCTRAQIVTFLWRAFSK